DIYRLKVAAHDEIDVDALGPVAASFGMDGDRRSAGILYERFLEQSAKVGTTIMRLMEKARKRQ
ncbi:MAG TPA: hypothetical protein VLA34_14765, partial [Candidatus Krumholzibacterium sp.]|nr:hypothetical protein [Candidatus Krumholzibacterium sp.]